MSVLPIFNVYQIKDGKYSVGDGVVSSLRYNKVTSKKRKYK